MPRVRETMDSYTIKQLMQATEGHDELPERALKLARQAAEHAYGTYDRVELLKSMAGIVTDNLQKNPSIPAPIQVALIKKLYGKGCPLESYSLHWSEINPNRPQFIAAIYYLAQSSAYHCDLLMKAKLQKVIAQIAFAQGKQWDALKPALESIDGLKRSYQLLESIPDLLANLHKHLQHDRDAVYLKKFGGVERLKAVGANLDAICKSVLKSVAITRLPPQNLLMVHQFLMDANQDLVASGKISGEDAQERHGKMMVAISAAMARKPADPDGCYHAILTALAPFIGPAHGSDLIPRLAQSMGIQEVVGLFRDPLSLIESERFKRSLKRLVDIEKRYDLVVALGVQEIFTRSELHQIKGAKLESALGL